MNKGGMQNSCVLTTKPEIENAFEDDKNVQYYILESNNPHYV